MEMQPLNKSEKKGEAVPDEYVESVENSAAEKRLNQNQENSSCKNSEQKAPGENTANDENAEQLIIPMRKLSPDDATQVLVLTPPLKRTVTFNRTEPEEIDDREWFYIVLLSFVSSDSTTVIPSLLKNRLTEDTGVS